MGDASTVDQLAFLDLIAGVPALLFGVPIAVLLILSLRRQKRLADRPAEKPGILMWLLAFLTLASVGLIVFFLTAVGFTT